MTTAVSTPAIGEWLPEQGGYFAGVFQVAGTRYGQVLAPKAEGAFEGEWLPTYTDVPGARHVADGLANTSAMAEAGSKIAQQVRALRSGGFDDWHLPARDQLELMYRHFKPGTEPNGCWFRDGDNPSSLPPGRPYTEGDPVQTSAQAFQAGGPEAFEPEWHWASTQYGRNLAWCVRFSDGYQFTDGKYFEFRARAVRRFILD